MYGNKFGMFIVNPFVFSQAYSYIVDDYSPVAAYSLRKLSSSATNAIRIRRSSDSAEQDIGFNGNNLDTASLSSFVGANDGFVVTWYNQGTSGATFDFSQSTAANQLRIVSSGTIETSNSSNTLYFPAAQSKMTTSTMAAFTSGEMFMVIESGADPGNSGVGVRSWKFGTGTEPHYPFTDGNIYDDFGSTARRTIGNPTPSLAAMNLYNISSATNDIKARLNTTQIYTTSSNTVGFSTTPTIGSSSASAVSRQKMTELIIFDNVVSGANRTAIESDINGYYSIY